MEERRPDSPASDAGHPSTDAASTAKAGAPDAAGPLPDAERRPVGALAILGFLTLTIMVFWYGMFALNMVRN
ncbi:MAG: cytochrome c oxidase subunit 2A [bacterium]|nr:cytochrome c oxidase subunit 2A [bacterium]